MHPVSVPRPSLPLLIIHLIPHNDAEFFFLTWCGIDHRSHPRLYSLYGRDW